VSTPEIFFENSDAKSGDTCCEISCFLKTTAKKLGGPIQCWSPNLKVGGPVSPGLYGCCAYDRGIHKNIIRRPTQYSYLKPKKVALTMET